MSDSEYVEKMRKRRSRMLIIAGSIAGVLAIFFLVRSFYYDNCTNGFDRSPKSVIESYIHAISGQDLSTGMNCWKKNEYYSLESGCSELCLQRSWGRSFQINDIQMGEIVKQDSGRDQITVRLILGCGEGGAQNTGEILLDTASAKNPWSHWKIISSTVGGTFAQPWCQ